MALTNRVNLSRTEPDGDNATVSRSEHVSIGKVLGAALLHFSSGHNDMLRTTIQEAIIRACTVASPVEVDEMIATLQETIQQLEQT